MAVKVKICGITNEKDALLAASLGASALGFIFYRKSPRYVSPVKAKNIIGKLPPFVSPVGVFVNESEWNVKRIAEFCGLSTLQFHGDESPHYCRRFKGFKIIKAFRVQDGFDLKEVSPYKTDAYLFDAFDKKMYGGSGKTFDWKIIRQARTLGKLVILSGGLNPQNVAEAIRQINPYAVDISSGVEQFPGKKNEKLLREFFRNILKSEG